MSDVRMKVACINWSHPAAPHAVTYALVDGEMHAERYCATWAEAIAIANRRARAVPILSTPDPCPDHPAIPRADCACPYDGEEPL